MFLYPAVHDGLVVWKICPVQIKPWFIPDIVDFDRPVGFQPFLELPSLGVFVAADYCNALEPTVSAIQ